MLKDDYLNNADVKEFTKWLATALNDKSITHSYTMPGDKQICFSGLEDALDQYNWDFIVKVPGEKSTRAGKDYDDNEKTLAVLSKGLEDAIKLTNDHEKNQALCDWSSAVMQWGGVTAWNVDWLKTNVNILAIEITNTCNKLVGNNDDTAILKPITRFNAGMTKVYSLLLEDFIIYDSRVAAALAWLVDRWCPANLPVPELLQFHCMPPKEGNNPGIRKIRNPSHGMHSFPAMGSNSARHAHWNLRASWILAKAINTSKETKFHEKDNPLRALEAALFMWGYDLGQNRPNQAVAINRMGNGPDNGQSTPQSDTDIDTSEDDWQESETHGGKKKPFKWRFDNESDAIVIDRNLTKHDIFELDEILTVIQALYRELANDWYPLANGLVKMQDGTEEVGLGSSIYAVSNDTTHGQAASQLGVILEDAGILKWNGRSRNIAWRLRSRPPRTVEELRSHFEPPLAISQKAM